MQAALVGALVAAVPALFVAAIEGLWVLLPPAILAAGSVVGLGWRIGFRGNAFSLWRSVLLGAVLTILSYVAMWLAVAACVALAAPESGYGAGMLGLGAIGGLVVLPVLLPLGILATVLLRKFQCAAGN
ncbi:MAG: hypothetical protein AB7G39_14455 [Alphaproteobacteria bacterium]